jgi:Holliday junction resolvase RusA-like endonuclease
MSVLSSSWVVSLLDPVMVTIDSIPARSRDSPRRDEHAASAHPDHATRSAKRQRNLETSSPRSCRQICAIQPLAGGVRSDRSHDRDIDNIVKPTLDWLVRWCVIADDNCGIVRHIEVSYDTMPISAACVQIVISRHGP